MKRKNIAKFAVLSIIILSLLMSSCPDLESNVHGEETLSPPGLGYSAWTNFLLYEVYNQSKYVHLDLSDLQVSNTGGSAFIDFTHHGKAFKIFNALPWLTYPADENLNDTQKERIRLAKSKIISITLPNSATMIDDGAGPHASAFRDFTNLRSVKGQSIEVIGRYAFYGLKNLREVDLSFAGGGASASPATPPASDAVVTPANGYFEHIGSFAFSGCSSLTTINFPSASIIGVGAFQDCTSLTVIGELAFRNVWRINDEAFKGCTKLTTVTFRNATKIGAEAFANCTSLRTAAFLANPDRLPPFDPAFPDDYHPLESYINNPNIVPPITYESVIFYARAFVGCTSLQNLEIPNAWNVYFAAGSLASIGKSLTMRLFDHGDDYVADNRRSYGHPQTDDFLGHRAGGSSITPRTIESITFILPRVTPAATSRFEATPDIEVTTTIKIAPLYRDINGRYGDSIITRTIIRQ